MTDSRRIRLLLARCRCLDGRRDALRSEEGGVQSKMQYFPFFGNAWRIRTSFWETNSVVRPKIVCSRILFPHDAADSGLCFWIPCFMIRYIRVFRVMPK
jgi:hypothetical protein